MNLSLRHLTALFLALLASVALMATVSWAQSAPVPRNPDGSTDAANTVTQTERGPMSPEENMTHSDGAAGGEHESGHAGGHEGGHEPRGVFDAHSGTWVNWLTRIFSREPAPTREEVEGEIHYTSIKYDWITLTVLGMIGVALSWVIAARRMKIRPDGNPGSMANLFEAAFEGFYNYLVGIMGRELALKYTPLISSFFFTILVFNLMGLVPGLLKPTTNPNVPLGMALFGFLAVHVIAIKEAGFKSWIMHFVGEPIWLAWLNFPLHIIGELIKPLSLTLRLLCNMFGEEMVVVQLTLLSLAVGASLHLPTFIPFQFPMLLLGTFFSFLQALVFATLLAIYLSIFATSHDDHGAHEHGHGGVEHTRDHRIVAHSTEVPVA